jgi:hypothetical protein
VLSEVEQFFAARIAAGESMDPESEDAAEAFHDAALVCD